MTNKMEYWELKQKQSLPLQAKINYSLNKIKEFYQNVNGYVYVAFSGGKDSTVLLHLVRSIYPNVKGVFSNTGLEYPEIVDFVKTTENIDIVRPEKTFYQVIQEYGYPVVSKKVCRFVNDIQNLPNGSKTKNLRLTGINSSGNPCPSMKLSKKWYKLIDAPFKVSPKCCDIIKKKPLKKYSKETGKHAIIGIMANEGQQREKNYLRFGCNIYGKENTSRPLSIWTEQDIWEYIKINNLEISSIYNTGVKRTGCMFCMFGVHLEKNPNRFDLMKTTHPKLYDYCMNKLGLKDVLDFIL